MAALPKITHVLELCLCRAVVYPTPSSQLTPLTDARSLPTSVDFYSKTLNLGAPFFNTPRVAAFSLGQTSAPSPAPLSR